DSEGPPPPPRSIRLSFTSDNQFLVAGTYPAKAETEKARKERKRPDEMPKQGLLIVKLGSPDAIRIAGVKSFQVPEKGGPWLAYLKEAAPAARPAPAAKPAEEAKDGDAEDQQRRGSGAPGGGGSSTFGTDLVLRDLSRAENNERTFASVAEYSFARDGKTLVYAVSSRKEEENGVFAATPGVDAAPAALRAAKGKYSKLAWDRAQTRLAFFQDKQGAWLWLRADAAASEVVNSKTPGVPAGMVVSEKGALAFSRDGKRLFVPVAPPAKESTPAPAEGAAPAAPASTEDKVVMDLWHYRDDSVQPMQKVRANQERNRTYRGVYHIEDKKYVQLASREMQNVIPTDDGLLAIGSDDRAYRRMVDYDTAYLDAYIVDAGTGRRNLAARMLRAGGGPGGGFGGPFQIAPDGKHAIFFNDRAWFLLTLPEGASRNVSSSLGVAFFNEEHDTPDVPRSYGSAGWSKDSKSFYIYDRYDVWQLFTDATPPRNVTAGAGRKDGIEFRINRIDPASDPNSGDEERGIDSTKPLTLRAESESTRQTGFYRTTPNGAPQRLLWGDRNYRYVTRAQDANVLVITAQRFDEFPDLLVTDQQFRAPRKSSDGGAQLAPFAWGTGELISYKNTDGVPLQAALYKPANFDPRKKYPLMVYFYERLSQTVHTFVEPRPSHNFNFAQYVSDGYVVLAPDIVYTTGQPGQSALKCILAAVQAVEDKGFIDPKRIGIAGHSWGGYQAAYLITQTNRFRAAEAGAPVGNMTSAYSGIRWGSGQPRQFQYEKTQSRIGKPLYDDPLKYIENSPVFHIKRVQTPVLLLHDDNDDAVPWYQGIELFLALRRNGKEAYLMNYNGELHGLRRRHNQMDYSIRMKQFFDHFLKDAEAPDWMKNGVPYTDREEEKERFLKAAGLK
ncbi:MAG: S9 family peptidase, partial [Acidobacteria bacterium]|nr:S9 family peptidase [Acidobacteriota bacterium]